MNRISKYLATGLLGLIGACNFEEDRTELSNVLHEDATVSETVYCPSRHGSDVAPAVTTDLEGNVGFGIASVSVDIPEKYAVVFKCKHGKFIVEGEDARHKALWQMLSQGEEVDVSYREVFKTTYKDINDDGKKELIQKRLVKYDFIDATPKVAKAEKAQEKH